MPACLPYALPACTQLLADGKRLLFVSAADYGSDMRPLVFARDDGSLCGWVEPPLWAVDGTPDCQVTLPGQDSGKEAEVGGGGGGV